jgi:hypothetical protein
VKCTLIASGLRLTGACDRDELRSIVSPGGSDVSWPPGLDSSPCTSLVSTCLGAGMGMAAVPVVSDLAAVLLASVVSCTLPGVPSSAPHNCCLGTGRMWCLPPIPVNSL